MNHKLIFLTGHRKGGTTMFHRLFDGHSSLNAYPVDLTVLYAYFPHIISSDASTNELWDRLEKVIFLTLKRELTSHQVSINIDSLKSLLREKLYDEHLRDPAKIIGAMLSSWIEHQGLDPTKPIVVKETSADIYSQEILEWFPNTQFIQLVRDPRDNYAALKAGVNSYYSKMGESEFTTLASLINRSLTDMKMALENPSIIGESRYTAIRFEDLVKDTEGQMKNICTFLDIPFDDHLTKTSFMGTATSGNNHDGQKMTGVSDENISRWKSRISEEEAMIIEFAFRGIMEQFEYLPEFPTKDSARAYAEYYKWSNYHYFFHDPFAAKP
jgi:hypothetical protein